MKRNILTTIGLVAAVFALLSFTATPASAKWKLKADFAGTIQITAVGPNGPTSAVYSGQGYGAPIGQAQMQGEISITGPADCAGGFTATHEDTLTASNGDQLVLAITETSCPRPASPNIFDCMGTYIITSGTGHFANESGSGKWSGTVTFSESGSGVFSTTYSE
jgi:hypothetical protein